MESDDSAAENAERAAAHPTVRSICVSGKVEAAVQGSLDEREASKEYGMSPAWYQRKRWDGTGPRYYKVGRAVRYPRAELDAYFQSRLRSSTSDLGGE